MKKLSNMLKNDISAEMLRIDVRHKTPMRTGAMKDSRLTPIRIISQSRNAGSPKMKKSLGLATPRMGAYVPGFR